MDLGFVIIGLVAIVFGAALTFSQSFTRTYNKFDPRSFIWRRMGGNDEEHFFVMHRVVGPLSILLGILIIAISVVLMVKT